MPWLRSSVAVPVGLSLAIVAAIVYPIGDFPLNDDWIYGETVRQLVESGEFVQHPLAAAMALGQVLWGTLFAKVFGFSYSVLRISTLTLALLTLWALARCALATGLTRGTAILCAVVLLANPIFLCLSCTFMTDVPALAVSTLAAWFFLRAQSKGNARDVLSGSALAVLAASIRQFSVFVAIAFALSEAILWMLGRRRLSWRYVAAFIAPWLAAGAAYILLADGLVAQTWPPGAPRPSTASLLREGIYYTACAALYGGLFTLPIACGVLYALFRRTVSWTQMQWVAVPWLMLAILIGMMRFQAGGTLYAYSMPALTNILYDLGVGPLLLRDALYMDLPMKTPVQIGELWWVITVLCYLGAAVTGAIALRHIVEARSKLADGNIHGQRLFLVLWALMVMAAPYHAIVPNPFDRYYLPLAVPLILLAAHGLPPARGAYRIAWAATLLVLAFSTAATQDYLSWNRARWQAVDFLHRELKVSPELVDAGYEYGGRYTFDLFRRQNPISSVYEQGPKAYWILDDLYAVSFQPRPGYTQIASKPYFSLLGLQTRHVLVLKRVMY